MTCALVASVVGKQHSWLWTLTNTLERAVMALMDDAVEFSFQVSNII